MKKMRYSRLISTLLMTAIVVGHSPASWAKFEDVLMVNGGDIPQNHWAAESVKVAMELDLMSMWPDKKFRGERGLSRYEMATFTNHLLEIIAEKDKSFIYEYTGRESQAVLKENGGDISRDHWAGKAVTKLIDAGFMSGMTVNGHKVFNGSHPLTRYEMAAILAKILQKLDIRKTGLTARFEKTLKENGGDMDQTHWAFKSFELVLSHGLMNLYDHRLFKGNDRLTRYELAYCLVQLMQLVEKRQRGEMIYAEQLAQHPDALADRLALVIGNANYQQAGVLKNSVNDARDMADVLKKIGFQVILKEELATRQDMLNAIRNDFRPRIKPKGAVLFYYAGHGMQINGQNYLVPTRASMKTEADKEAQTLSLDLLFEALTDAGTQVNIVMLDACRNNPFAQIPVTDGRGVTIAKKDVAIQGLANINNSTIPIGTYISYATAAGQVASDGNSRNGLYTQELLKALQKKGAKIEDVDKEVRKNVRQLSAGKQIPWQSSNLESDFVFFP